MWEILSWLFFLVFIAALIVVGALLLRGYLTTGSMAGSLASTFFPPKPEKRLEVVDQANVDGRRRLLLIRRDDVEHLVMTGGPVDVVIETGISAKPGRVQQADVVDGPGTVFSRPGRAIGQAVGEP
ncbi:MAG: hypothetical protein AB7O43_16825 [Hyphomicrobiaceae bacterium]